MTMSPRHLVRGNITARLSAWVRNVPELFYPIALLRETPTNCVVHRDTELVIEGAPRCGNHFAVAAFQVAQGVEVKIAHHFHAPAQVKLAVKWGIPCVVLIRRPLEQIVSNMIFNRWLDASTAIYIYSTFLRGIMQRRDEVVIADFSDVTQQFNVIIDKVNERYGTSFCRFWHTASEMQQVERRIDALFDSHGSAHVDTYPLPCPARASKRGAISRMLLNDKYHEALGELEEMYERLKAGRDRPSVCRRVGAHGGTTGIARTIGNSTVEG
jgi:hypothetical protein